MIFLPVPKDHIAQQVHFVEPTTSAEASLDDNRVIAMQKYIAAKGKKELRNRLFAFSRL